VNIVITQGSEIVFYVFICYDFRARPVINYFESNGDIRYNNERSPSVVPDVNVNMHVNIHTELPVKSDTNTPTNSVIAIYNPGDKSAKTVGVPHAEE